MYSTFTGDRLYQNTVLHTIYNYEFLQNGRRIYTTVYQTTIKC